MTSATQWVEQIEPTVRQIGDTLGPADDWLPTLFFDDRNGNRQIIGLGIEDRYKAQMMAAVGQMLRQAGATSYALVMTAYVLHSADGPPGQDVRQFVGQVKDTPGRREVVIITAATGGAAGQSCVRIAQIFRSMTGAPVLGAFENMDDAEYTGTFDLREYLS